jgi:hypothetical protein
MILESNNVHGIVSLNGYTGFENRNLPQVPVKQIKSKGGRKT